MKKFLSMLLLVVLLSMTLMQSTFAYYTSVDGPYEFDSNCDPMAMKSHSNGDIFTLCSTENEGGTEEYLEVYKYTQSSQTWAYLGGGSSKFVTNSDTFNYGITADMAINSSGYPVIAYVTYPFTPSGTHNLNLAIWNGSSYDITTGALTTGDGYIPNFSLDLFSNDYPALVGTGFGGTGPNSMYYYEGTAVNTFAAGIVVDDSNLRTSYKAAVSGDPTTGTVHVVSMPRPTQSADRIQSYVGSSGGSSWAGPTTIAASVSCYNSGLPFGQYKLSMDMNGSDPRFAFACDNESGTDYIYMGEKDGGTWDLNTVYSGTDIGGSIQHSVDIVYNGADYVFFTDMSTVSSPVIKMAYSADSGTNWTVSTVNDDNTEIFTNTERDNVAWATSSSTGIYLHTEGFDDEEINEHFDSYWMTEPAGGGESVPEFSTYVYIAMILLAFGIMYYSAPKMGMRTR